MIPFESLAETLERCGVSVEVRDLSDDDINIKSGLCEIGGKKVLIIDKRLSESLKVEAAIAALKEQDLENIFVPPAIRSLIED